MLFEAQSDSTADSIKSVSSEHQPESDIDSTQEILYWQKAGKNNLLAEVIQEATGLLGHAISAYSRDMAKQLNRLKKF